MILRKFYISIILRVLLISLNIFLVILAFRNPNYLFSIIISTGFLIFQLVLLIKFLNRINRNLANFLSSILYKDGTFHLSESTNIKNTDELSIIINSINNDLKNTRIENEKQYAYLKQVIEHIEAAIIVLDSNGNIELLNNQALILFKKTNLKTIFELDNYYKNFSGILLDLLPKVPKLVNIRIANEELFLSVRASVFKIEGKEKRLVSFHVINEEMNETEIRSWEKLIRVLTHEIMNSVSPITSLITTLKRIFKHGDKRKSLDNIHENDIDDTISGLEIIHTRSQGLIDFIKKYRKVHLMPKPVFEIFEIKDVLDGIKRLFQKEIEKNNITCTVEVYPENLKISADKAMIEQALINLFKNSVESFENNHSGYIKLKSYTNSENNIVIDVEDNGSGISEDIMDDIFIPFFSTKKNGSGIGLSLVKQLVILNNAKLNLKSEPGKGTHFIITFN